MRKKNSVFIATSLDGFIADKKGNIDWLHSIENPTNNDMGYAAFVKNIDAMVMGRNTFETVSNFDCPWPYEVPVFVLSNSLHSIAEEYKGKVFLINGPLSSVLKKINDKGFHNLYIDGGRCIQEFLKEDLIDEMIITTIPILLGGGSPLFSDLPGRMNFELIKSEVFLGDIVQNHFKRKK